MTGASPAGAAVKCWLAGLAALAVLVGPPAQARTSAPPPAKAVPASFYAGVWYEIARTPNTMQRHCAYPSTAFEAGAGAGLSLVQTCRQASAAGPAKVTRVHGSILSGSHDEKFAVSFLGGLIRQEYWVLDYAGDGAWAIMATPGGHYVWLLARRRDLPAPVLAAAVGRVRALGYTRLEYPAGAVPP